MAGDDEALVKSEPSHTQQHKLKYKLIKQLNYGFRGKKMSHTSTYVIINQMIYDYVPRTYNKLLGLV